MYDLTVLIKQGEKKQVKQLKISPLKLRVHKHMYQVMVATVFNCEWKTKFWGHEAQRDCLSVQNVS